MSVYHRTNTLIFGSVSLKHERCIPLEGVLLEEVSKLKGFDMNALLFLVESNAFKHNAKCMILESLNSKTSDMYWRHYEMLYGEELQDSSSESYD